MKTSNGVSSCGGRDVSTLDGDELARAYATAKALVAFQEAPGVFNGLDLLIDTNEVLNPAIKFIGPAQTTCNYLTLWFRNVASVISEDELHEEYVIPSVFNKAVVEVVADSPAARAGLINPPLEDVALAGFAKTLVERERDRRDDVRRPPVLPDRRRGEGVRGLSPDGPRRLGSRLDAARRQRGGPGRRRAGGRPRRASSSRAARGGSTSPV